MPHIDALSAVEDLGDGHTWFKLAFDITDAEAEQHVLELQAMANSPLGAVGFKASVPLLGWTNQELPSEINIDWGRIALQSIGAPTDALLRLLEQQFQCQTSSLPAAKRISCTAVLLADDPAEIETAEMHSKLFFDSLAESDPDSYAELYFNFDVPARRAYLMEKDPEYRSALLKWLDGRYLSAGTKVH
jgi:hypothetical protein